MGTRTHPSDSPLPGAALWGKGKLSAHQSPSGKKKKEQAIPLKKGTEGWDSNFSCLGVGKTLKVRGMEKVSQEKKLAFSSGDKLS